MYVIDVEIYVNYFLLAAKNIATGKTLYFEKSEHHDLDIRNLRALMRHQETVSFNGNNFDLPIIACAIKGWSTQKLKALCDKIIKSNAPAWQIIKDAKIKIPSDWDHIDTFDVSPGRSSLKIYGGRMHMPRLQDLPIEPSATLTREQMEQIKSYCVNDLDTTIALYRALEKSIELRADMSEEYGIDLRSKSDAQVAEEVIRTELERLTGHRYYAPKNPPDRFRYQDPGIVSFRSTALKAQFERILKTPFETRGTGSVKSPEFLKDPVVVGGRPYKMGIGGLHSQESAQMVEACDHFDLLELDVTSYYPSIILQQDLAPDSIGKPFLDVYRTLVDRRIKAKRAGDKVENAMLKIAINGSFGKLGSKYSAFYAPDLLIQTTMTGQLALLMLIERLHAVGIDVVSANTDGVVVYVEKERSDVMDAVAWGWMLDTTYGLEETNYRVLASRNVNNYIAVTTDGRLKRKGCFASPGLSKNPDFQIVYEAVAKQVASGVCIEETISRCADLTKFVSLRRVTGGAVWRDQYLGKAVRFYYSTDVPGDEVIAYKHNLNTVPKSAGAKPVMDLPDVFPNDVNFEPYIDAANDLLVQIGYSEEIRAQMRLI